MLCDRCNAVMQELDGGRAFLCNCGRLRRPDGAAAAIGERVDALRAVGRGAVEHARETFVETAEDLQSSLEGALERGFDRIFGPGSAGRRR